MIPCERRGLWNAITVAENRLGLRNCDKGFTESWKSLGGPVAFCWDIKGLWSTVTITDVFITMMMRRNRRAVIFMRRRRMTIVWLLRIWNVDIILANVLHIDMALLLVFRLSNNIEVNRASN